LLVGPQLEIGGLGIDTPSVRRGNAKRTGSGPILGSHGHLDSLLFAIGEELSLFGHSDRHGRNDRQRARRLAEGAIEVPPIDTMRHRDRGASHGQNKPRFEQRRILRQAHKLLRGDRIRLVNARRPQPVGLRVRLIRGNLPIACLC